MSSKKLSCQLKLNFVWNLHGQGVAAKVCLRHLSHITKMAAMPIFGLILLNFLELTCRLLRNSVKHTGLRQIILCSSDDPELTWTYSMSRSPLVVYVF